MKKSILKPFKKNTYKISHSSIDFDKIHKIMDFRIKCGYSAYECSFLLGKTDFFFRDAENPLSTKRYNPDDTNYLQLIFETSLSAFMSPKIIEDLYHLQVTAYLNEDQKPVYDIAIRNEESKYGSFKVFTEEDKHQELHTPLKLFTFEEVKTYIDTLLADGTFNEPKTAFDIFNKCKKHFGEQFHARNMIKVLNYYTNKKSGIAKLNNSGTNNCGRKLFVKCNK